MKKETIELVVTVDLYYDNPACRKRAVAAAKECVLAVETTFAKPRRAALFKRPKVAELPKACKEPAATKPSGGKKQSRGQSMVDSLKWFSHK